MLRRLALGLAISGAVGIAYGASLGFGFVYDDHVQLQQNPWLRDPAGPWLWLTRPFWGFDAAQDATPSNYYRPVFGLFYSVVARTWGLQPAAFHGVSVLLHAAVSLLVAAGARRLGASSGSSLLAGTLFAVHPVHVESVAWVAAQVDLLCAVFALIAILGAIALRHAPAQASGWTPAFVPLCFLLACLTKETGVALLLVLVAAEAVVAAGRASWRRVAYSLAALAVYLALRIHALGGGAPRDYHVTATASEALALGLALFGRYLRLLVFPAPAHVFATVDVPGLLSLPVAGGAAAALALIASLWLLRRRPAPFVALVTLLAFLAPPLVSNRVGGVNFAERYLYLPSIGFAWLVALGGDALRRRVALTGGRGAALVAAGGLVSLALVCRARAEAYRNDRAYFEAAVRSAPSSPIARNNLGAALGATADWEGAAREYAEALRLDPGNADAWANLGAAREHGGDLAGAVSAYERALDLEPRHVVAGLNLSRAHRVGGNELEAAAVLDRLLAAGAATSEILLDRALLHLREGNPSAALELAERATVLFPEGPRGFYLLAQAHYASGDLAAAESSAAEAVRRGSGPGPHRLLALLCWRRGDVAEARRHLEDALRLAPSDAATLQMEGLLEAGGDARAHAIIPLP